MSEEVSGTSKEECRTAPSSPRVDIIEDSDDEASSFFSNSKLSQNTSSRSQPRTTKRHGSNNSMRKQMLKRTLETPTKGSACKKPKAAIDDTLFFHKMFEEEFVPDTSPKVNNDANVDNILSISQQNAFIVDDPFTQMNSTTKKLNSDLDEFQFTQYCDNTQFMNQIETAITKIQEIHKSQPLRNISNVSNSSTAKKYTSMSITNKQNLFDATFNDALCDLFKSTQYQREVEQGFDKVEKSICLMGNQDLENEFDASLNESVFKRTNKVVELLEKTFKSPETLKQVLQHADESVKINKEQIAWTDESFLTNVSSFGNVLKNAMSENINKTLSQSALHNLTLLEEQGKVKEKERNGEVDELFIVHGEFFGLPNRVRDLFKAYKGIDKLYDWQYECLNLPAISQRKNLIYALPTSGGKTLVAEVLILREILCRRKNALFILPYVAIVQEKVWAMSPFAVALEFLVEEYAGGKGTYPPRQRRRKNSVYVCTIEKASGLLNSLIEAGRTDEIGLIVIDELHLLGDGSRGTCLEAIVTKTKMLKNKIQMVGMSATIGNIDEIGEFMRAEIYTKDFRPVELVEYVKCQNEIARVNKQYSDGEQILVHEKTVNYYKNAEHLSKIDPDHLGGLVADVIPDASCLIFCKTRQNCENVAKLLCRVIDQKFKAHRSNEKQLLKRALEDEVGSLCKVLAVTLDFGIAYHHSGLTSEERRLIEDAFRLGTIAVICCTSTLAAGVNLPAKRVIIRNPYVGREFINLSRYKQMVGRAGRAGYGEIGESIVICTPSELPRVRELFLSPMDIALSSMHEDNYDGLLNFLLSCVSLRLATTKVELQNVAGGTLMAAQAERLGVDVRTATRQAIRQLFKNGALQTKEMDTQCALENTIRAELESSLPSVSQNVPSQSQPTGNGKAKKKMRVAVHNDTPLEISKLGSAAIKGGLDLAHAHILYEDLLKAQASLVLLTGLHLMYLVTPYTVAEQVNPGKSMYYSLITSLKSKEVQTAKVLGFTEIVTYKMLTNRKITEISERVMNRFFVTLMLHDLWNEMPVYEVAVKYEVNRGLIQNLMTSAASFASNVFHFCGEFDEFWAFSLLLKGMSDRLSHCCVKELVPLMMLPAVKQNRAKQLFNAGYKTLQSVARAEPEKLTNQLEFMSRKLANQLVAAAKMILLERVENLREEAEQVIEGVNFNI